MTDVLAAMPKYEAYIESGVEWLDDIPDSWNIKPGMVAFSENKRNNKGMKEDRVLSLSYGNIVIKPPEKLTGLVPESFETYQLVEPGDIIIRCMDLQNDKESLRIGLAKDTGIITSAYLNLKVKDGFISKYLYYYFHSLDITKAIYKYGSGLRQNLSYEDFRRLPIFEIPLAEQTAIANFLDRKTEQIDQAVAIKEKQIALLKERKQILIQNAVTRGLDPSAPMKDSGIEWVGEIPVDWKVTYARYCFRVVRRNDRDGTEVKFSVTQKKGLVPTDEMKESSTQAVSFDSFQICHKGDLVLNKYKAHLGVFWRAPSKGIVTNNYTVFSPLKGNDAKFFEILFHTPIYKSIFRTLVYGVTDGMMPLYTNDFYNMKVIVPDLSMQKSIIENIEKESFRYDQAIKIQEDQIDKIKEYKSTFINSAVTGKIKVA